MVSTFGIEKLLYFPMLLLVPLAIFGPALMRQTRSPEAGNAGVSSMQKCL